MKHLFAVIFSLLVIAPTMHSADESSVTRAWELMAGFSSGEALKVLEEQPVSPEQQLAVATALLGKYPQTPQNVDAAERILLVLLNENEKSEYRVAAFYLLGRIAHIFREGRSAEAGHYYRQLRENYPDDQLADSAAVKLALIAVEGIPHDASAKKIREELDALAVPIHRSARSDFHYLLAEYFMERGDLSAALERLLKVRELGINRGVNRADILIQIGRIAAEVGQEDVARLAYHDFIGEFPTDTRKYVVQDQLRLMDSKGEL